jgi:flagellar motor switch protein FliN/FliY
VAVLEDLKVDLTVVLGRRHMPLHLLLRMGRGAVIELESTETDMVEILANDHPIARGQIVVTGNRISVEVTELIRKAEVVRLPGVTIGEGAVPVLDGVDFLRTRNFLRTRLSAPDPSASCCAAPDETDATP